MSNLTSSNNSEVSNPASPKAAAIVLRRVPDNQDYEIWVTYPNPSSAVSVPSKRGMIMAFSGAVTLTLARQIAHLVAQNYGLASFREES
jgi:hypothetical protein